MRCVAYNSTAAVMPRGRQCDLPYEAQHRLSDVMYFVSISCGDVTASISPRARWALASRFGSHSASTHRQVSAEALRLRGCSMQLTLGRALQVSTSVGDTERREIRLWAGHHERHEMAASAHDAVLKAVGDGEPATPISSIAGTAASGRTTRLFQQAIAHCDARNDQRFKEAGRQRECVHNRTAQEVQQAGEATTGETGAPMQGLALALAHRGRSKARRAASVDRSVSVLLQPLSPAGIAPAGLTSPGRDDYIDLRPRQVCACTLLSCPRSPYILLRPPLRHSPVGEPRSVQPVLCTARLLSRSAPTARTDSL